MTDRVSTIIPTYNYGHFVTEAVESALSQTYPNVEVIVVDDGSTDDTVERLVPFANRIRLLRQRNQGLSAARNAGIRLATGIWIGLLDADDIWHRQKLEVQLAAAGSDAEVALIGSLAAPQLPLTLMPAVATRELTVRDFLLSARTGPSGALIRRSCFDTVGWFDETLTSIEDRDMWLRIAARFRCIQVVSPCWWYRPHAGQMSRRASRMMDNYEKVLTKFFAEHPEHIRLRNLAWSYLYLDSSWTFFEEGDVSTARRLMWKSLWLRPASLGDPQLNPFPRARVLLRILRLLKGK